MARTKAMAATLTAEQKVAVDAAVLASFGAIGRSRLKLAEIDWYVAQQCTLPGGGYERYRFCDSAVQRLKRDGRLELVRGAGGGWQLAKTRAANKTRRP